MNMNIKLSQWAEKQGLSYLTAYRWFKAGKIKNATQDEAGTIMISVEDVEDRKSDEIDLIKQFISVMVLFCDKIKNVKQVEKQLDKIKEILGDDKIKE